MPYIGGETPTVGDYVKNEYEQFGSVTRIRAAHDGQEYIWTPRWDGGGATLLSASAADFTLLLPWRFVNDMSAI